MALIAVNPLDLNSAKPTPKYQCHGSVYSRGTLWWIVLLHIQHDALIKARVYSEQNVMLWIFCNKISFQFLTFPCRNIIQLAIHVRCTVEINMFVS